MTGTDTYWIVRCAPARTLQNTKELKELGFDAWAPIAEREYRKARSKKYIRVVESLLPSFIFVAAGDNPQQCAERLDDLRMQLGIRVMRERGKYCGTSEASLAGLRAVEHDAQTFGLDNMVKGDTYEIGQEGTVNSIAFMGLTCKLVGRSGKNLIILMSDSTQAITIKPSMFVPAQNNAGAQKFP